MHAQRSKLCTREKLCSFKIEFRTQNKTKYSLVCNAVSRLVTKFKNQKINIHKKYNLYDIGKKWYNIIMVIYIHADKLEELIEKKHCEYYYRYIGKF